MEIISLFFPALISLKISLARNTEDKKIVQLIIQYGVYVLVNNWIVQSVITYILNVADVTADALNSFPFFTKYIAIAIVVAVIIPVLAELVKKYFKVSIETGILGEEGKSHEKKD